MGRVQEKEVQAKINGRTYHFQVRRTLHYMQGGMEPGPWVVGDIPTNYNSEDSRTVFHWVEENQEAVTNANPPACPHCGQTL